MDVESPSVMIASRDHWTRVASAHRSWDSLKMSMSSSTAIASFTRR